MDLLSREKTGKVERPVRVLQFGEGNFLRAFVDYMIDIANEQGRFNGDIVLVKPIEFGSLDRFHEQECQYTVQLRGIVDGEPKRINRIVTSVADAVDAYGEYEKYAAFAKLDTLRYIVSNTTEAGIVYDDTDRLEMNPPKSYPGKLTKFLYERYKHFNGAADKGLVMLPVELIDDNGIHLKECVLKLAKLWNLEEGFTAWLNDACVFTSTLVDRIVTGYPRDEAEELCKEFGYQDNLIVTGEPFAVGKWQTLIPGGQDAVILAYGRMTLNAIQASELLVKCGLSVGVIDCCSLKPMDMDCLRALFARGAKLITVEEGEMIGGFGSEIARVCVEENADAPIQIIGLENRFITHGSVPELLEECGLMPRQLADRIEKIVDNKEKSHVG